ncbi:shikimate dehydrogenase [uncultured Sphingomonas sp.]|uniref:shikimate dehydrogenase n=1 Tax=uncultured Sphingomonas sp. TaxID=158754 RepID=UPI00258906CD|nr:shikimate dehydrogenase [uncultured Sphingomonas sp.]
MSKSGLIGRAILASRSPWLHEQEARAAGFDLRYTLFDFDARHLDDDALPGLLGQLRDQGYAGVNVTYPFKQAVIPHLDALADSAQAVGAVNTIAMRDGRMTGHNTDMTGFRDSLRDGLPDARLDRVLQFGAGGAGAAVATALLSSGVRRLELSDVDAARAEALAASLTSRFDAEVVVRRAGDHDTHMIDGIVNASPVGMKTKPGMPIAAQHLDPRLWVADIVYFPRETELLRTARTLGCATLDGSGMVIRQAAAAFEIITGRSADIARMATSFEAAS